MKEIRITSLFYHPILFCTMRTIHIESPLSVASAYVEHFPSTVGRDPSECIPTLQVFASLDPSEDCGHSDLALESP